MNQNKKTRETLTLARVEGKPPTLGEYFNITLSVCKKPENTKFEIKIYIKGNNCNQAALYVKTNTNYLTYVHT